MEKNKILRVLVLFFVCLYPKLAFPFWPIIGAGLAIGGALKAQYSEIMAVMRKINETVSTVELALLAGATIICIILILWSIKIFFKRRKIRKFQHFALSLLAIRTEMVFKKTTAFDKEKLKQIEQTKNELLEHVDYLLHRWFFVRKLNKSVRQQMLESLEKIKSGSLDSDHQLMVIDQLLRQFSLIWV